MKRFDELANSLESLCSKLLAKEDWELHAECEKIKSEMLKSHASATAYEQTLNALMDEINGEIQQKQD